MRSSFCFLFCCWPIAVGTSRPALNYHLRQRSSQHRSQAPLRHLNLFPGMRSFNGKGEKEKDALSFPADAKPILVDTGLASWYGAPYHNRHGSNGKIYDMNAMTAAHRTLPLGSIVRVTNVKTGHSAIVRITDRGPFIEGRILDLSLAAAKKVDVWRPGIAAVRMEVLRAPFHSPRAAAGRCRSEPSVSRI